MTRIDIPFCSELIRMRTHIYKESKQELHLTTHEEIFAKVNKMNEWVIPKQAGGTVTDGKGNPFTWGTSGIIAANKGIGSQLGVEPKAVQAY